MAQYVVPGLGWIVDGGEGGDFVVPGSGWINEPASPDGTGTYTGDTIALTAGGWTAGVDASTSWSGDTINLTAGTFDGTVSVSPSYAGGGTIALSASSWSASGGSAGSYAPGEITLTAGGWTGFGDGVKASQAAAIVVAAGPPPPARASQAAVLAVAEPPAPPARASEAVALVIGEIVPGTRASQGVLLIVADASPCVTRRADIWIITRRDGTQLAFTSHDQDLDFGALTAKACGSLTSSATEQSSAVDQIGNVQLEGIIDHADITEEDLFAGAYDDAFIEVWRVSWDAAIPEAPVRLSAGNSGNVEHGERGFKMDILGPGIRLSQQSLVLPYTPGCRWVFGSSQCGVNADLYVEIGTVISARNRGVLISDLRTPGSAPTFANGTVLWTYGRNAGTICEVKSVDFSNGEVILWSPAPYLPAAGDSFELKPGCDKSVAMCKLYNAFLNYGGFPDVPGTDAIMVTPDQKL